MIEFFAIVFLFVLVFTPPQRTKPMSRIQWSAPPNPGGSSPGPPGPPPTDTP